MAKKTLTIDYDDYHNEISVAHEKGSVEGFKEGEESMANFLLGLLINPKPYLGEYWQITELEKQFKGITPLIEKLFPTYKEDGHG